MSCKSQSSASSQPQNTHHARACELLEMMRLHMALPESDWDFYPIKESHVADFKRALRLANMSLTSIGALSHEIQEYLNLCADVKARKEGQVCELEDLNTDLAWSRYARGALSVGKSRESSGVYSVLDALGTEV